MWFDRKTDTYIPEFEERIKLQAFEPELIPGINDPQISQAISVET
jgi:hypothetical protein